MYRAPTGCVFAKPCFRAPADVIREQDELSDCGRNDDATGKSRCVHSRRAWRVRDGAASLCADRRHMSQQGVNGL